MIKQWQWALAAVVFWMGVSGCMTEHKIESFHRVEVAPMHITIDVNVKVDRALDNFFDDIDRAQAAGQAKP